VKNNEMYTIVNTLCV